MRIYSSVATLLSLVCPVFTQGQAAQPSPVLGLSFTSDQIGSPVVIKEVQSAKSFPYATARLKNISGKDIEEVVVGVILTPLDRSGPTFLRIFAKSLPISVDLRSGEEKDIDEISLHFPALLEAITSVHEANADADFGIVAVRFGEGPQWTSEVVTALRFLTKTVTIGTSAPCARTPTLLASTNPYIIPAALDCVSDSKSPTTCSLNSGICTMSGCNCPNGVCYCGTTPPANCPCQKCKWQ